MCSYPPDAFDLNQQLPEAFGIFWHLLISVPVRGETGVRRVSAGHSDTSFISPVNTEIILLAAHRIMTGFHSGNVMKRCNQPSNQTFRIPTGRDAMMRGLHRRERP